MTISGFQRPGRIILRPAKGVMLMNLLNEGLGIGMTAPMLL